MLSNKFSGTMIIYKHLINPWIENYEAKTEAFLINLANCVSDFLLGIPKDSKFSKLYWFYLYVYTINEMTLWIFLRLTIVLPSADSIFNKVL